MPKFSDIRPCRSARHYGHGIPATHMLSYPDHTVNYYCFACVVQNGDALKALGVIIAVMHPLEQSRSGVDNKGDNS